MIKPGHLFAFVLTMTFSLNSFAAERWLVVSDGTSISAGQKLSLDIIKPAEAAWPPTLKLQLSGAGVTEELELTGEEGRQAGADRRSFVVVTAKKYVGVVKANLAGVESNQFLLLAADEAAGPVARVVEPDAAASEDTSVTAESGEPADSTSPRIVLAKPGDEPALSAHEPLYFVLGHDSDRGG